MVITFPPGGPSNLVGGQIQLPWVSIASVLPHVKAGKLRALAVSTASRTASAPEVPTVAEQGYPGFEYSNWNALFAPAKTPQAHVRKINASVVNALKDPDTAAKLSTQGADPAPGSPEELGRYMRADYEKWKKVIAAAGLKP